MSDLSNAFPQDSQFIVSCLLEELKLPKQSIESVMSLLDAGNTIPFIARYRKEVTGHLDEVQIKAIHDQYAYYKELQERKKVVFNSIESQGKLTEPLKDEILACKSKTLLEDLYLPYKPKRRTRALIAKEKGIGPLAEHIMEMPANGDLMQEASLYLSQEKGVDSIEAALGLARDIIAEMIAENAAIRAILRGSLFSQGIVVSKVIKEFADKPTKFEQYYDFKEKASTIPSHRYLAIRRGESEGVLEFYIEADSAPILDQMRQVLNLTRPGLYTNQIEQALQDAYKRLLLPSVETDIRVELKMRSDKEAVDVFAENLRHLLMAAPLGSKSVIGIDPGFRTGCKCAAIDMTGKFLETMTFYLFQAGQQDKRTENLLLAFIKKHQPFAIAIGNGTAGRETEMFVKKLLKEEQVQTIVLQVSEAGASVYSASDTAREEFPDLDLTVRGAISIARRLQDPLAELVKIDPKSIGVGQYQHDVYQPMLQEQLQYVVEACVNQVGVDLNTASTSLLSYVSGIGASLAGKIVKYRDSQGVFQSRQQLLSVPGFGPKTFEQAAGFLRVRNGSNPLDATAVHPERYGLVQMIADDMHISIDQLFGKSLYADKIDIKKYISGAVGQATLKDIQMELKKPGRDPRNAFEAPNFRDDIMTLADLKPGMKLEGIVTNVTAFGAFVDIGVHQDGLVHISALTDKFIKHPSEVVSAGMKIKVEVLEVDADRKRIALSAKSSGGAVQGRSQTPKKSKASFDANPFANL